MLGFALIPFVRRDDRTVLRWAAIMLLAPIALYAVLMGLAQPRPAAAAAVRRTQACRRSSPPRSTASRTATTSICVRGNVVFTIANVVRRLLLMFFPRVLGMFLLGFYAGRRGDLRRTSTHMPRCCAGSARSGFAVGLPLSLVASALVDRRAGAARPARARRKRSCSRSDRRRWRSPMPRACACCSAARRGRCCALAPAGRMALTNYLAQSVAGVLIFYGIGFRLFGRVSLTIALAGSRGVLRDCR